MAMTPNNKITPFCRGLFFDKEIIKLFCLFIYYYVSFMTGVSSLEEELQVIGEGPCNENLKVIRDALVCGIENVLTWSRESIREVRMGLEGQLAESAESLSNLTADMEKSRCEFLARSVEFEKVIAENEKRITEMSQEIDVYRLEIEELKRNHDCKLAELNDVIFLYYMSIHM